MPEIIHDYIHSRHHEIATQLEEAYQKNTCSCIVKFIAKNTENKLIGHALYYLYIILKGSKPCLESNTCYDGEGEVVPPEAICKIEYLLKR